MLPWQYLTYFGEKIVLSLHSYGLFMLNSCGNAEVWVRVGVEKGHFSKTNAQEKSARERGNLYLERKWNLPSSCLYRSLLQYFILSITNGCYKWGIYKVTLITSPICVLGVFLLMLSEQFSFSTQCQCLEVAINSLFIGLKQIKFSLQTWLDSVKTNLVASPPHCPDPLPSEGGLGGTITRLHTWGDTPEPSQAF